MVRFWEQAFGVPLSRATIREPPLLLSLPSQMRLAEKSLSLIQKSGHLCDPVWDGLVRTHHVAIPTMAIFQVRLLLSLLSSDNTEPFLPSVPPLPRSTCSKGNPSPESDSGLEELISPSLVLPNGPGQCERAGESEKLRSASLYRLA